MKNFRGIPMQGVGYGDYGMYVESENPKQSAMRQSHFLQTVVKLSPVDMKQNPDGSVTVKAPGIEPLTFRKAN